MRNFQDAPRALYEAFDAINAELGLGLSRMPIKLADDVGGAAIARNVMTPLANIVFDRNGFGGGSTRYDLCNLLHEMVHVAKPASGHGGGWLNAMLAAGVEFDTRWAHPVTGFHRIYPGSDFDRLCARLLGDSDGQKTCATYDLLVGEEGLGGIAGAIRSVRAADYIKR
jgi:hypothetical protein